VSNVTKYIYDKNGVPFYNYGHNGFQRNPLFIAQEVTYHIEDYLSKANENSKNIALSNANWLVENATPRGNYSILYYNFPFASYDVKPPWRSALAQAKAVEALADAHKITNNQTYLDTAKSLLNSFFVEIKDGGVTIKTPNDGWWYEEYADEEVNPPRVLNGMLMTLYFINKYYEYTNDTDAKYLFDQGIMALRKNLPLYDNNGNSYYDINKKPASSTYHGIHIGFLKRLLDISEDDILRTYHDKWEHLSPST
jgi:hypothetical protein